MPIRLNLLAEAQAAEELRRRDPVKRGLWLGSLLVALALAWSGYLYVQILGARRAQAAVEKQIQVRTNEHKIILDHQKKLDDINRRLAALRQLATNRFLQGTLLNGLQHVSLADVALVRVKVEQTYTPGEEVKAKTNSEGRVTAAKPATVKESISVTLDAKDTSLTPGADQVTRFKEAFSSDAYFQTVLSKTDGVKLKLVGPRTTPPEGRPYVLFTLECKYPDQTR